MKNVKNSSKMKRELWKTAKRKAQTITYTTKKVAPEENLAILFQNDLINLIFKILCWDELTSEGRWRQLETQW